MERTTRWTVCGLLGLIVVLAACGSSSHSGAQPGNTPTTVAGAVNPNGTEALPPGDIPDNQVFVAYTPQSGVYSIRYPQGWSQRQTGNATTFSQNFNSINIVVSKTPRTPTIASARSSEVPKLRTLHGFELVKIDVVTRASGPAVRLFYRAASAADPVTGKSVPLDVERYLFWHNGTLVTLTLSSPKGSDNVDPWRKVTDSLVWK